MLKYLNLSFTLDPEHNTEECAAVSLSIKHNEEHHVHYNGEDTVNLTPFSPIGQSKVTLG